MAARNAKTRRVGRTGGRAGFDVLGVIQSALARSARRTTGVIILVLVIVVTMNYNSKPTENWLTAFVAKLQTNAMWKWMGDYLSTRIKQLLHSMWIMATAFLATTPNFALLVTIVFGTITLSLSATTNADVVAQCAFIYLFFGTRNATIKLLTIIVLIITVIAGHVFIQYV